MGKGVNIKIKAPQAPRPGLWETVARGLLLGAPVIVTRLRGPFAGPIGYLKACVVGETAWPAALVGIFGTFVALGYLVR